MNPSENHRRVAARFGSLIDGVRDWNAPTPVEEWKTRDVVRHLLDWFPPFLETATGVTLAPGPDVDTDPAGAWNSRSDAVQHLLDRPQPPSFDHPQIGSLPFAEAIDRFYTADVFLHSWDLARGTGQDDTLDPTTCAAMLAGMEPIEELMRSSGQYGPRVEVADDADIQSRLIAFIGRDPAWRP